jgi:hypothetical protein
MKKKISVKMIVILSLVAVVLGIAILGGVTLLRSIKNTQNYHIEHTASTFLSFPKIDKESMDRFEKDMEEVLDAAWKREKFEDLIIDGIEEIQPEWENDAIKDGVNFAKIVYEITAQQILLEAVGVESEDIKEAYDAKIAELHQLEKFSITDSKYLCAALMEEPYPTDYQDEKVYDVTLKYYTAPRTYFLETYLPAYMADVAREAITTKETGKLIGLGYKLSLLSIYPEVDINALADVQTAIDLLTADAQVIQVKEGMGGYYDGAQNDASQDNKSDELFDYVASTITGTEVNSNSFKFKSVKYYGDLAGYYFESGLAYSYKDENGKTQYNSNTNNSRRVVFLKGEAIHEGNSVNEKFLKYGCEDGMVNYYKDGRCFAVGNGTLACYVGSKTFALEYSKN